ncbi:MAG: hypothetical protein HFG41_06665 [Coprococcus sp.]|nr:hypothetical protein [Coprococcus sp.]
MKKFIRYLYEYQNGRRVQNVGFVKVEEADDFAVLQIYGKGFPAADGQSLEILVFYQERGGRCVGIPMGKVTGIRPMFGYRLEFTVADVGSRERFRDICGVILLSGGNGPAKWYAAIWDERSVNIEGMVRQSDLEKAAQIPMEEPKTVQQDREQEKVEEEPPQEGRGPEEMENEEPLKSYEMEEEEPPESQKAEETEMPPESQKMEETEASPESQEINEHETNESKMQTHPFEGEERVEIEEPEEMPGSQDMESAQEEDTREDAAFLADSDLPHGDNKAIHKITRQDMVRLPRREWKLANNNFLLHGCHNYHHLVSFEKDGKCWIGVPGIYHPNEQRAATAFGFDHFMRPEEGEIELLEEEKNDTEDFGYWCRVVSTVI